MSGGTRCKCPLTFARVEALRVNYSAFNGYHRTPSRYSAIRCICCAKRWRTTAAYVDTLMRLPGDWDFHSAAGRSNCSHKEGA